MKDEETESYDDLNETLFLQIVTFNCIKTRCQNSMFRTMNKTKESDHFKLRKV